MVEIDSWIPIISTFFINIVCALDAMYSVFNKAKSDVIYK